MNVIFPLAGADLQSVPQSTDWNITLFFSNNYEDAKRFFLILLHYFLKFGKIIFAFAKQGTVYKTAPAGGIENMEKGVKSEIENSKTEILDKFKDTESQIDKLNVKMDEISKKLNNDKK